MQNKTYTLKTGFYSTQRKNLMSLGKNVEVFNLLRILIFPYLPQRNNIKNSKKEMLECITYV